MKLISVYKSICDRQAVAVILISIIFLSGCIDSRQAYNYSHTENVGKVISGDTDYTGFGFYNCTFQTSKGNVIHSTAQGCEDWGSYDCVSASYHYNDYGSQRVNYYPENGDDCD